MAIVGGDWRGAMVVGGDWLPVTMEELLQIASNNDMQDNVEVHKEES